MKAPSFLSTLSRVSLLGWLSLLIALTVAPMRLQAADPAQAPKTVQLTGCVDEDPGPQYVLRGDKELRLIAKLQPDGFPVQAFAKYLGHKITVTGQLSKEGDNPVMKVKIIKEVAKSCVPPT